MSVIAFNGPILLFPVLFDAGSAGHFSKAVYVLYVIPLMIGNSFSQVLFQQMAELRNKGNPTEPIVRMTLKSVLFIGTIPLVLVGVGGPEIFSVLLGPMWAIAGQYSQFLTVWLFFLLISTSLQSAYMVFEKQEIALLFNFLAVVLRLGILFICAKLVSEGKVTIVLTVILFSIASAFINLAKVMYIGHLIKLQLLQFFQEIRLYLLFMIIIAAGYVLIKQLFDGSDLMIFFAGALLGGLFYAVLLFTQPALKELVLSFMKRRKRHT
jgi:O-antigen/teichoic acid export membrane protein